VRGGGWAVSVAEAAGEGGGEGWWVLGGAEVRPLTKTWASREWRAKRVAFLTEHPGCEMPGCTQPATVINHRVKANIGLVKWKEIKRNIERSKKNAFLTAEQITALTNEKYQGFKARVSETYLIFTPQTVEALCKRCNYAREHGKVLCLRCRVHYHNPRFPMCFECNKVKAVG